MQFTITTAVQALSLILGAAEFALAQETKVTSIFLPENPEHDFAMSVVEVNPSETVYAITCAEGSEDECLMAVTMTVTEGPSSFYHANTMGSTTATISCDIAGPSDAVCEVFVKTEEDSEPLIISPTYSGINLYVEATITAGLEKFEDAAAAEPTSTQASPDAAETDTSSSASASGSATPTGAAGSLTPLHIGIVGNLGLVLGILAL